MKAGLLSPHGTSDSVTVHSMGGLGNQLFIYSAGLAAARAAGVGLRVDVGQHSARTDRPPVLEALGFPAEYVDCGFDPPSANRVARLRSRVQVPRACTFRESSFRYDQRALEQRPGACLFGYFQSWRYLAEVADELRGHFARLEQERRSVLSSALARITAPGTIALHVRRGDYLAPGASAYHGLAGQRYYQEAVAVLRRLGHDGPLIVFSDDLNAAVDELEPLGGVEPVEEHLDAVDELLVMGRSSALVTANSSFSWWAGWIGERTERPVIAPRPWFDDLQSDSRDLLLPHWLTLDRREAACR